MRHPLHVWLKAIATISFFSLLSACGGGGGDDSPPAPPASSTTPWTVRPTMGNFTINSNPVVTNEDGVSLNMLSDYVMQSALPNTNLEYFTLNAYVPTTDSHSITVTVNSVQMRNMSNQSTGNIYYSADSRSLSNVTIGGQRYAVFRLAGVYNGSAIGNITRSNFANINFNFRADYRLNGSSTVVQTRTINLEVYKR